MIVNPYNIQTNKKPQEEINSNAKLKLNEVEEEKKVLAFLFENYRHFIEKNNIQGLNEVIAKELRCNYGQNSEIIVAKKCQKIISKIFGYGILQKYIDDNSISDIRVVRYDTIYIKRLGGWEKTDEQFQSEEEFNEYIRFCATKNNMCINTESPICIFSDRKNSLRIEAGISPTNVDNDSLVIRIHRKDSSKTLEELLLKFEMLDVDMYKFLVNEVKNMKSFVICGKGGSGKTTLMKAMLELLPPNVAITSLEETAELFLNNRNVIQRECILNRSQENKIDLEKLTKHSLVMSNDVIVLGELKRSRSKYFF